MRLPTDALTGVTRKAQAWYNHDPTPKVKIKFKEQRSKPKAIIELKIPRIESEQRPYDVGPLYSKEAVS